MNYTLNQVKESAAWDAELCAETTAEQARLDLDSIGEITEGFYNAGRDDEFHTAIIDAINGNNVALTQMIYDAAIAKVTYEQAKGA